jgi:hypothetical protein
VALRVNLIPPKRLSCLTTKCNVRSTLSGPRSVGGGGGDGVVRIRVTSGALESTNLAFSRTQLGVKPWI